MLKRVIPLFLVIGVAVWSVWPAVSCGGCVADYGRDGELITWIINTTGRNIYGLHSGAGNGIFDGNIFYPYRNVLAYSDMFFLTAFWAYPAAVLSYNPTLVNTITLLAGQIAVMVVMYMWWNKITGNNWASAVATIAFGLSQIRSEYQVHLQMWSMQYMLAGTWLIVSWIDDKEPWKLYAGSVMLGLQVWESLLPVYFGLTIIAARLLTHDRQVIKKFTGNLMAAGVLFSVLAALPLSAYWGVSRQFDFQRDIREAAHNGMGIEEIFTKFGSSGLYVLLTIGLIKIAERQNFNNEENKNILWLIAVMVIGVLMAMGPVAKTGGETVKIAGRIPIPLPYAAAYYLVPGFGALRTPSRWIWIAGWAASGLTAVGLAKSGILKPGPQINLKTRTTIVCLLITAAAGGKTVSKVRKLPSYNSMPAVYKKLESMPGKVILEVPMGDENLETDRMVYSLYHGKTLVNGFSGIRPPDYRETMDRVNDGLDSRDLGDLKKLGVDYIVVNNSSLITPE